MSKDKPHQCNYSIEYDFSNGIRPRSLLASSPVMIVTLSPKQTLNLEVGREKPYFSLISHLKICLLVFGDYEVVHICYKI